MDDQNKFIKSFTDPEISQISTSYNHTLIYKINGDVKIFFFKKKYFCKINILFVKGVGIRIKRKSFFFHFFFDFGK